MRPNWNDKGNRKARWQQKIIAELNLMVPSHIACAVILEYMAGRKRALDLFEIIDKKLKRRARFIPRPTWRRLG